MRIQRLIPTILLIGLSLCAAAARAEVQCFGEACFTVRGVPQRTVLHTDGRGAYAGRVTINGRTVRGVADTGASYVTMSARTADELAIPYATARPVRMRTANGTINARAIMLSSVTVGSITMKEVEAVITETDHPLLIGMSFLRRVSMSSNGDAMTLVKR